MPHRLQGIRKAPSDIESAFWSQRLELPGPEVPSLEIPSPEVGFVLSSLDFYFSVNAHIPAFSKM